ncbi:MAG: lamin tail domain-containing protein [Myxococcales bacterium]|nr:lamin tail domain-containing protein [Myxococcales bacterium]
MYQGPGRESALVRRRRRHALPRALPWQCLILFSLVATACQPGRCRSSASCGTGEMCVHGFCVRGTDEVVDGSAPNGIGGSSLSAATPCGAPPNPGELRIEEVLSSPAPTDDLNGDEIASTRDDEFIEIVNRGPATLDLDGVSVWLGARLKHRFQRRCLASGYAIVLFSGGTAVWTAPGAQVLIAEKSQSIANDGVTLTLKTLDGGVVDTAILPKLPVGHSGVRGLDGDAQLIDHALAPYSRGRRHSVGHCTDGSEFPLCVQSQRSPSFEPTFDRPLDARP